MTIRTWCLILVSVLLLPSLLGAQGVTSATFVSSEQRSVDTYHVTVTLQPGNRVETVTARGLTNAEVLADVTRQLDALNKGLTARDVLAKTPPGTAIPIAVPVVPPPTQLELNRLAFDARYRELRALIDAMGRGITPLPKTVAAATTDANAALALAPDNATRLQWLVSAR